MIELRNSKIDYLGKTRDGRHRYSAVCYQGAAQMLDKGIWIDIKPRLVRDIDGWHVEGAPYYAEIKDDGTRLLCPHKDDKSKYLRLPAIPLLSRLTKSPVFNPTKVGKELLPNQIVMPTPYGRIVVSFTCDGMKFEMLLSSPPPFNRLQLPIDSNLDIASLLKLSPTGEGIPRPRLVEEESERFLDWAYKTGELELYLPDDIKYPALFSNATYQVAASLDDATERESGTMYPTITTVRAVSDTVASGRLWPGLRWAVSITQGSTIDSAVWSSYLYDTTKDDANFNIHFQYLGNPLAFTTTNFDITSRTRTAQSVSWVANSVAAGGAGWYDSPSLVTPLQDVATDFSITAIVLIGRPNTDVQKLFYIYSWDHDSSLAAKFVLTWTEPSLGIGACSHQHNPWGINEYGGITG